METLKSLDGKQMKDLLLQTLAWRVGDMPDLPAKLSQTYSLKQYEAYQLIELICPALDYTINNNPQTSDEIFKDYKIQIDGKTKQILADTAFENKEKFISFCEKHVPSLSRVVYHDWTIETQIATESLGRIARPIASITLRIQPESEGKQLLPPLRSVSMKLAKDMIDALSSGFDRLQNQLSKIIK
ncbi:COMM domain-containing protein 9 [Histomonas meleagridis]|uniref:COMM domain-containing protein 9 n=1 Tax=Histomonas meleagridis TaxID=135588 RepID=UPI0035597C54|nr:COMM domain-containing protein 9 [Histomonas meleagridis]KAH0799638.1 COMM domain-containing protein 9 [Histomonas meleagridis]